MVGRPRGSRGRARRQVARRTARELYVARSDAGIEGWGLHAVRRGRPGPADPVVARCWRRWSGRPAAARASGSASAVSPVPDPVPGATRLGARRLGVVDRRVAHEADGLVGRHRAPTRPFWRPFLEYLGSACWPGCGPVPATSPSTGGTGRRLPLEDFMELTARRELTGETGPPPAEMLRPPPLGQAAFGEAVRPRCATCTGPTGSAPHRWRARRWARTCGPRAGRGDRAAGRGAEGASRCGGCWTVRTCAGAEPGGGGGGARPAVQHLPALPRPGGRAAWSTCCGRWRPGRK